MILFALVELSAFTAPAQAEKTGANCTDLASLDVNMIVVAILDAAHKSATTGKLIKL